MTKSTATPTQTELSTKPNRHPWCRVQVLKEFPNRRATGAVVRKEEGALFEPEKSVRVFVPGIPGGGFRVTPAEAREHLRLLGLAKNQEELDREFSYSITS